MELNFYYFEKYTQKYLQEFKNHWLLKSLSISEEDHLRIFLIFATTVAFGFRTISRNPWYSGSLFITLFMTLNFGKISYYSLLKSLTIRILCRYFQVLLLRYRIKVTKRNKIVVVKNNMKYYCFVDLQVSTNGLLESKPNDAQSGRFRPFGIKIGLSAPDIFRKCFWGSMRSKNQSLLINTSSYLNLPSTVWAVLLVPTYYKSDEKFRRK